METDTQAELAQRHEDDGILIANNQSIEVAVDAIAFSRIVSEVTTKKGRFRLPRKNAKPNQQPTINQTFPSSEECFTQILGRLSSRWKALHPEVIPVYDDSKLVIQEGLQKRAYARIEARLEELKQLPRLSRNS